MGYTCDTYLNNTSRSRQNGYHFADDIFKCFFLNENVWISLRFVPKGLFNNIPALVQIMAWRRAGDKPLSEPMMITLLMQICVTRPQWVKCVSLIFPANPCVFYLPLRSLSGPEPEVELMWNQWGMVYTVGHMDCRSPTEWDENRLWE